MVSRWGHSFERSAIIQWLAKGNTSCPITRKPMSLSDLISNRALEEEIFRWKFINAAEYMDKEQETVDRNAEMVYVADTTGIEIEVPLSKRGLWKRLLRARA
jgi:U-box domain